MTAIPVPTSDLTRPAHALPRPAGRSSTRRQLVVFVVVGAVTTLAYLLLYAGLQPVAGSQVANAAALLLTADANTIGNRRFGFGLSGRRDAARHHAQGLVAFAVSLVLTSVALAGLESGTVTSVRLAVLLVANTVAGLAHFALLRFWVFARRIPVQPTRTRGL
ncbi:MAG TPA: GtrA family protein [Actinomycetales bacterium]|nr:GtrA family protein [Actinomycetales bacterium]